MSIIHRAAVVAAIAAVCGIYQSAGTAQTVPRFEIDAKWPKDLPGDWITGRLGGVCMDAKGDNVFVVNRADITEEEKETSTSAPSIIKFNAAGDVVASWGDQKTVPGSIHGCFVDLAGNVWVAGNGDGMIQKYDPAGKLIMQIGQRGKFDSVDGTRKGKGTNSAQDQLHMPSAVVIDPDNGEIFVSDGYGNRRVVVFDKDGKFLRQWGRQATDEETQKAVPGVFAEVVHCIHMSNAGLIYVCDRQGNRVQVFRKDGTLRAQHCDPQQVRQAAGQARHRLVGGVLARQGAALPVRHERRHRAGAHPRSQERRDPVELRPAGPPDRQLHPRPHHHGRLAGQHLRGGDRLGPADSEVPAGEVGRRPTLPP